MEKEMYAILIFRTRVKKFFSYYNFIEHSATLNLFGNRYLRKHVYKVYPACLFLRKWNIFVEAISKSPFFKKLVY